MVSADTASSKPESNSVTFSCQRRYKSSSRRMLSVLLLLLAGLGVPLDVGRALFPEGRFFFLRLLDSSRDGGDCARVDPRKRRSSTKSDAILAFVAWEFEWACCRLSSERSSRSCSSICCNTLRESDSRESDSPSRTCVKDDISEAILSRATSKGRLASATLAELLRCEPLGTRTAGATGRSSSFKPATRAVNVLRRERVRVFFVGAAI